LKEPTIPEIKEFLRTAPGMVKTTRYIRFLLNRYEELKKYMKTCEKAGEII